MKSQKNKKHLDNTYQMIRDYVLSSLAHIELLAFGILGV